MLDAGPPQPRLERHTGSVTSPTPPCHSSRELRSSGGKWVSLLPILFVPAVLKHKLFLAFFSPTRGFLSALFCKQER